MRYLGTNCLTKAVLYQQSPTYDQKTKTKTEALGVCVCGGVATTRTSRVAHGTSEMSKWKSSVLPGSSLEELLKMRVKAISGEPDDSVL